MQGRDPIVYAACRHSPCRSFFIPNLVVFDGIYPYLSVVLALLLVLMVLKMVLNLSRDKIDF